MRMGVGDLTEPTPPLNQNQSPPYHGNRIEDGHCKFSGGPVVGSVHILQKLQRYYNAPCDEPACIVTLAFTAQTVSQPSIVIWRLSQIFSGQSLCYDHCFSKWEALATPASDH